MATLSILYLVIGAFALLAGLAMLGKALKRRGEPDNPRATAMLIAGMMVATFGLLMSAFWIAFATGRGVAQ
ncbi:hypothetical protein [Sphingomonas edaphi]|uniref:Uncharacterized protein n=1 Tax=Sphingomonas edaphi TaxID=2315689 RepID=A0A418Q2N8_9SPHN|nr:hypothetical protein [Sphingomonas edaphi]RIX32282.1 hypothetical protein D3M59_04800 [Sphingomonas edaphi]